MTKEDREGTIRAIVSGLCLNILIQDGPEKRTVLIIDRATKELEKLSDTSNIEFLKECLPEKKKLDSDYFDGFNECRKQILNNANNKQDENRIKKNN
jgi:hypothetical protein